MLLQVFRQRLIQSLRVPAYSIASGDITNWNLAYGWGDHSTEGYLTSSSLTGYATESYVTSQGYLTSASSLDATKLNWKI